MTSLSTLAVIVGVIGALVGIYFRESLRHAYRQKFIATKLYVQINSLFREMGTGEYKPVFLFAWTWSKERLTAFQTKGSAGYLDIERKYEAMVEELKNAIEEGNLDVDKGLEQAFKSSKAMPQSVFDNFVAEYKRTRDSFDSGTELLTDEEAAELSWDTAGRILELRTRAVRVNKLFFVMFLTLREMEEFDSRKTRSLITPIIVEMIYLCWKLNPCASKQRAFKRLQCYP